MLFPNAAGNRFVLDDFEGDTPNTFLWLQMVTPASLPFAIPAVHCRRFDHP
ncbi:MAG: hypothetical protein IPI85_15615 [Dehalococcoidia bacterium]|nr:hypothetical protein [Dehalococcoidia bacterium]